MSEYLGRKHDDYQEPRSSGDRGKPERVCPQWTRAKGRVWIIPGFSNGERGASEIADVVNSRF